MTTLAHHREPPAILPARHARPSLRRTIVRLARRVLAAVLRNAGRACWIAVRSLGVAVLLALMCWEIWVFAYTGAWEPLVAAAVVLAGGPIFAFWAFTTDRTENNR